MNNDTNQRRRQLLAGAGLLGAGVAMGATALAAAPAKAGYAFPRGFLWGAAVAGHQVEGGNINSDGWLLENVQPTVFAERSGDAVDHYRLFVQDIVLVASLGLNTFRFSIEWSRVEPEEGMFSTAALEHYREVLEACHRHNVKPMVSFNHFTVPRWFAARGGWENDDAPALFGRYCDKVARHLGHLMAYATTFNEPNLATMLFGTPGPLQAYSGTQREKDMLARAGQLSGTGKFSSWLFGDQEKMRAGYIAAHKAAYDAIHSAHPKLPVGFTIAIADDQAVGDSAMRDRKRAISYEPWFALASTHADFLGLQCYTRSRVTPEGELPPEAGVPLTDIGYEFYPQALEAALRYAATKVKLPLYVTENGIATGDDAKRVDYIRTAVQGVANCLTDGIDVRGYIHWSLLDNFEWNFGYAPRFGIVAVDRATQRRTPKPSARLLGSLAKANRI
ncbi:beta-glucosidase [Duganella sp. CF402]|uniref:glycoside hydrolase family 1 protein n=1 Tax=unclassified Duganella TaxID=2636909 RepID=UPI0008BFA624|nr:MULTISPECIES: family 1 glycosylhydrolase [unclassified Duganella]RZT08243.1 aryl-beta-glucosidase [Duganella sp. BK701]SEM00939.1 beta-glucosidase [Duganella sp. CF402]